MMFAITDSAKQIARRLHPRPPKSQLFLIGMVAIVLMLAAELAATLYIAGKDWNGLTNWVTDRVRPVYFAMLSAFAVMPTWIDEV